MASWDKLLSDIDGSTAIGKFINAIHGFMRQHREKLGLDGDSYPYIFITNDLVSKYLGLIKLCQDKDVDIVPDLENITCLFIDTYDEEHKTCRCCKLYHSVSKERFIAMVSQRNKNK